MAILIKNHDRNSDSVNNIKLKQRRYTSMLVPNKKDRRKKSMACLSRVIVGWLVCFIGLAGWNPTISCLFQSNWVKLKTSWIRFKIVQFNSILFNKKWKEKWSKPLRCRGDFYHIVYLLLEIISFLYIYIYI